MVVQIQRFLAENGEVAQLRQRQGLLDLDAFSLDFEVRGAEGFAGFSKKTETLKPSGF